MRVLNMQEQRDLAGLINLCNGVNDAVEPDTIRCSKRDTTPKGVSLNRTKAKIRQRAMAEQVMADEKSWMYA